MDKRRTFILIFFPLLTVSTTYHSLWQYKRYKQSLLKWTNIKQSFDQFKPQIIDLQNLPFSKENLYDWEYQLVKVSGFHSSSNKLVSRWREGRYGHMIISALKDNNENGIIINEGWIPQEYNYEESNFDKNVTITGILRKAEVKDYLNVKYEKEKLKGYESFINMQEYLNEFQIKNEKAQFFYIERIEQDSNIEQNEMYPYKPTEKTFEMPYLTPQKHIEYSTFWGCCSFIGLFTIQHVFRKW